MLHRSITKENIETLVTLFYHKAMKDAQIGHFFVLELGEDIENEEWIKHIDILVDFWASVFLDDPEYSSDPYGPHFTIINLQKEDFVRWMEIFSDTADSVYVADVSQRFKDKGAFYSKEFMRRLKMSTENTTLTSEYW
jgi:hemoglobin